MLQVPGTDKWYIIYHRRPPGNAEGNHRQVCVDETHFDQVSIIQSVKITSKGGWLRSPFGKRHFSR